MALNLRLRGIIRVDPCHPLAYKILHLGCVKFESLGEVRNHTRRYQLEHYMTPSTYMILSSVYLSPGLRILTYYLVLKLLLFPVRDNMTFN